MEIWGLRVPHGISSHRPTLALAPHPTRRGSVVLGTNPMSETQTRNHQPDGDAAAAERIAEGAAQEQRGWHDILAYHVTPDGRCDACGTAIAGRFDLLRLKRDLRIFFHITCLPGVASLPIA